MRNKVLIIGPVPGPPGGVASVVEAIMTSPLRQEYGLAVLDTAQKRRLRYNPEAPGLLSPFYILWHLLKLGHLLHAERVEIVHLQSTSGWSFLRDSLFIVVAGAWKKKVVCHFHGMVREQSPIFRHRLLRGYFQRIMRCVDVLILLSPGFRSDFERIVPDTDKRIVPNFVAPFDLRRERQGIRTRVLYVGRLSEKKGVYDLLKTAAMLKDASDIRFELAGLEETPTDKDRIVAELKDNGLEDKVHLAGHVQGEEKTRLFARSDLLVLPSHTEIFPIVILEAMAAGMPVIATPVGGVPDMVAEGVNGFIVPRGDHGLLAERIQYLHSHPDTRKRMGRNNLRKFNEQYSLDANIDRIREIYRDLLDDKAPIDSVACATGT